ncbi:MAG: hydroxymethylbilane synthase [Verrucomicrobiota bacterium]
MTLILGTRASALALAQNRLAAEALRLAHPELEIAEKPIRTTGDERLDVSLSTPGALDKGLFTRELENALLRGEIHAAVHSLKDLPIDQPPGLVLAAILPRADPSDCLASKHPGGWRGLPAKATVATCSPRRKNQLLHLRPDLHIVDIRGNIDTRLHKLAASNSLDALILARAALDRLGDSIVPPNIQITTIAEMLPAPGQGAIAIQCRESDSPTLALLTAIHHEPTARCVNAERNLLRQLGGGCAMPLGTLATIQNGELHLQAAIFHDDARVERLD